MAVPVLFYTRRNCSLCEAAEEVLVRLAATWPLVIERVDIDTDPELREAYGWDVPLVLVAGEPVARHRIDEVRFVEALRRHLARQTDDQT